MKPRPGRPAALKQGHTSAGSTWWEWECFVIDSREFDACSYIQQPTFEEAVKSLERHQAKYHACPDCGGCGYDVNHDGTDNGPCLRCGGHGVWLGVPDPAR